MPTPRAYAELHCHSNFSFLDGVSHPHELVEEAVRLRLSGLAITDHDGMYAAVQFADAAARHKLPTVFGAELTLGLTEPRDGEPDPAGEHLLVLARGAIGYSKLCSVMTSAHLRGGQKGFPLYDLDEVVEELRGEVLVFTGCRKGAVRQALAAGRPADASAAVADLVDRFGGDSVFVELVDHGDPYDSEHNDILAAIATEQHVPTVATNQVHHAGVRAGRLAQTVAAIRARRSLDEIAGWLPASHAAHLRSAEEMLARFGRRYPGAVARTVEITAGCAFRLRSITPRLPPFPVEPGHTEDTWLRKLALSGAAERYGPRAANPAAYRQIEHELAVIKELGFAGYFLIMWEIVRFCHESNILCQGRGSAANSAVCYALKITLCDPLAWDLLFERFLSTERETAPDIDLDIEADRREEVIQHVYSRYGRRNAALVANVISYRPRMAVRDVARALGFAPGQQDAWSRALDHWAPLPDPRDDTDAAQRTGIPELVLELAGELQRAPRHLGIHPGGMVICDRPVSEIVPIECARMDRRTIIQWDKDDAAAAGLVKFDLLGLGMLSAVRYACDHVEQHTGARPDLAHLDLADERVYDMLCAGDTVGVFQVESRAQMATLPRLRPRSFSDLAVEVALIRPGPIQGGAVHPYLARRRGESWQHAHPLLARALDATLGVPLFQEQIMQLSMDVAGFSAGEADLLRRAMGSKRSIARMEELRQRFIAGALSRGVEETTANTIYDQVAAFAGFGFPKSHALSFAYLVFSSAWLKLNHPSAFLAGLLRPARVGFYSPQTLVADARRHGVRVRGVDVNISDVHAGLEPDPDSAGGLAVRLGLGRVRTIGAALATRIVAARAEDGPFRSQEDLARRVQLTTPQLEALATAGAFADLTVGGRRAAIWESGAASRDRRGVLPGTTVTAQPPSLPGMTSLEVLAADLWATGMSPDIDPMQQLRGYFTERGFITASALADQPDGDQVTVAGAVTHRQRPQTANGVTFLSLEDETGLVNAILTQGLVARFGNTVLRSSVLAVRGRVEHDHGAVNLLAEHLEPISRPAVVAESRDWA